MNEFSFLGFLIAAGALAYAVSLSKKITALQKEVRDLRSEWRTSKKIADPDAALSEGPRADAAVTAKAVKGPTHSTAALREKQRTEKPAAAAPSIPPPVPVTAPAKPRPAAQTASAKPARQRTLELALGGNVASYIGIVALLIGVGYFVVYAIQNNWIGPGVRVLVGLLSGAALLFAGHRCESSKRDLGVLARCLTGGGFAVIYFCIYAASAIYDLVPLGVSHAGLLLAAAACLGVSVLYRSQVIATLAELGGLLVPLIVDDTPMTGVFPLVYVLVVNVPVIVLAVRYRWHVLLNVAFATTWIMGFAWIFENVRTAPDGNWVLALFYVTLCYLGFAVLGIRLRERDSEAESRGRTIIRELLNALVLLLAVPLVLGEAGLDDHIALGLVLAAMAQAALGGWLFRSLGRSRADVWVYLYGAVLFVTIAAPVRYSSYGISVAWSLLGLALALLGRRFKSTHFLGLGMAVGALAVFRSTLLDVAGMRPSSGVPLFWNPDFGVAALSALLLGVQSALQPDVSDDDSSSGRVLLACGTVLAIPLLLILESYKYYAGDAAVLSMIVTAALVVTAVVAMVWSFARAYRPLATLAMGAFCLIPLKILLADLALIYDRSAELPLLWNTLALGNLAVVGAVMLLATRVLSRDGRGVSTKLSGVTVLRIACAANMLALIAAELYRVDRPWSGMAVTLFFGCTALALGAFGLIRNQPPWRYFALALFGCDVVKAVFVDFADLEGLARIGAFVGLGVLLLILSYVYQRLAPRIDAAPVDTPGE